MKLSPNAYLKDQAICKTTVVTQPELNILAVLFFQIFLLHLAQSREDDVSEEVYYKTRSDLHFGQAI